MPKIALKDKLEGADWSRFRRTVKVGMIDAGMDHKYQLAEAVGVSRPTLAAWMENPGSMTIIQAEALLDAIGKGSEAKAMIVEDLLTEARKARMAL